LKAGWFHFTREYFMRGVAFSQFVSSIFLMSLFGVLTLSSVSSAETPEEKQIRILSKAFDNQALGGTGSTTRKSGTSRTTSSSKEATAGKPVPFDSKAAPKPEVCFASFLKKAYRAKKLEELLPYLTQERREFYAAMDQVAKKDVSKKANALGINPFGNSAPTDSQAGQKMVQERKQFALDYYKALARKIDRYVSTKVDGNQATIEVTAKVDVNINGKRVTKAHATVMMVGEGKYWRFVGFIEGTPVQ